MWYIRGTLYHMKDSYLSLRLPAELAQVLSRRARRRGVPKSHLAREAVARYLAGSEPSNTPSRSLSARALAARWPFLPRLEREEADALRADILAGRKALPALRAPWP